jgi:hypothetical protein
VHPNPKCSEHKATKTNVQPCEYLKPMGFPILPQSDTQSDQVKYHQPEHHPHGGRGIRLSLIENISCRIIEIGYSMPIPAYPVRAPIGGVCQCVDKLREDRR